MEPQQMQFMLHSLAFCHTVFNFYETIDRLTDNQFIIAF